MHRCTPGPNHRSAGRGREQETLPRARRCSNASANKKHSPTQPSRNTLEHAHRCCEYLGTSRIAAARARTANSPGMQRCTPGPSLNASWGIEGKMYTTGAPAGAGMYPRTRKTARSCHGHSGLPRHLKIHRRSTPRCRGRQGTPGIVTVTGEEG